MRAVLANAVTDWLLQFLAQGGPFMVPLAICAVVAIVVAIRRTLALRRRDVLPRFLRAALMALTPGTDTGHLWQLVKDNPAALARITKTALLHMDRPREENTEVVQTAARKEIMRLEKGLAILELIVGISPLIGLLGAISGLVGVFSNLGTALATADTGGVALGIAEALYTTVAGLVIAIPTLVIYTYLSRKVGSLAVEMETLVADLLAKCYVDEPAAAG
jgi:biopolymer transport protein ExbB